MPRTKSYLKPKKGSLIVPRGRKETVKGPETAEEVMAGMKGGDVRTGVVSPTKPTYVPLVETLTSDTIAQKRALQSLLAKYIMPNSLSSKSTADADKRSLVNKLNRRTLQELKELVPDRIKRMSVEELKSILDGSGDILDEEKVEIQNLYMGTSP